MLARVSTAAAAGVMLALLSSTATTLAAATAQVPAPPARERIELKRLSLPPLAPSNATGACTAQINPRGTGCIQNGVFGVFQSGSFLPDGQHVLAQVTFIGAPQAPDPASIYAGQHVIVIKVQDNAHFPSGDAWKCLTCGVPASQSRGVNSVYDYPQSFRDGRRLLLGTNVLDCGKHDIASPGCNASTTFIYPLHWQTTADGSGATGAMRELRLHPDQVHLQFNSIHYSADGIAQNGYFARLAFNLAPTVGIPLAPRYDVVKVSLLVDPARMAPVSVTGSTIKYNPDAITIGEARGFTGDGSEILAVGYPAESCNIDIFATHLATGAVRRVTSHPEYCDPLDSSPDNKWLAIADSRGSDRQMFLAGMRGIPPITDLLTSTFSSSTRNNGLRRFFQLFILDQYGDRGSYIGQRVTGDTDGLPGGGAWNDPDWNAMADPRWSLDSTKVVFHQFMVVSPACGGANPLVCPTSKEPGGHDFRVLVATFPDRKPTKPLSVPEHPDAIPWAIPYVPGNNTVPGLPKVPAGVYTLQGKFAGSAQVNITYLAKPLIGTISVVYSNYSDDGLSFLNGNETVSTGVPTPSETKVDWYSHITQSGAVTGTKLTGPGGYHALIDVTVNSLENNGTLRTTLNGVVYENPASFT